MTGDLFLGWDSGVSKSPLSRSALGATVRLAELQATQVNDDMLQIQFCSIACLRQFFTSAIDELERRAASIAPQVQAARERQEP
ncbi:MAG: hypothetical protein ACRC8S_18565 [Fimbriiglobus sp.]